MSDEATTQHGSARPTRPWLRVLLGMGFGLGLVVALAITFAVTTAAHLERVLTWARVTRELDARHISVKLASGSLSTSGMELRDLTVRITKARKNAPVTTIVVPLLRVDASLWNLAFARTKRIERVRVEGLSVEAMRYARDENDPEKGKGDDGDDEESTPLELAKTLAGLGQAGVALGSFDLRPTTFVTERRSLTTGKVVRLAVAGLEARASFDRGSLAVALGAVEVPIVLAVTRSGAAESEEKASLSVSASLGILPGGTLDGSLAVSLLDQTFDARAPRKSKLLAASIHATTDVAAQEVRLSPVTFDVLDGIVAGSVDVVHRDTPKGSVVSVRRASLNVQAARIPNLLATSLASRVELHDAEPLHLEAQALSFGPDVVMGPEAFVTLDGTVSDLRLRLRDEGLAVRGLACTGRMSFGEGGVPGGNLHVSLARLEAPQGIQVDGVEASVDASLVPRAGASPTDTASSAKGDAAALHANLRVKNLKIGSESLHGLNVDARGTFDGETLLKPSLALALAGLDAASLKVSGVAMQIDGPPSVVVSAKPPFDVSTSAHVSIASASASEGLVSVENVAMTLAVEGLSSAARPMVSGTIRSLRIANGAGKKAESRVAFDLAADAPMDLFAAPALLPRVHAHLDAFLAKVSLAATPHGKGADVHATVDVSSLAGIAPLVPSKGPTLCPKSLGRTTLSLALDGYAAEGVLPKGHARITGLELCGAPISAKAGLVTVAWDPVRAAGEVHARMGLEQIAIGDDAAATRSLEVDLRARRASVSSGELVFDAKGERMPAMHLAGSVAYAAKDKSITFGLDANLEHLELLPAQLRASGPNGIDALGALRVNGEGTAKGLLDRWDASGVVLAPQAFTVSSGHLNVKASLQNARIHGAKNAKASVGSSSFEAAIVKNARNVTMNGTFAVDGLEAESAAGGGKLDGVRAIVSLASADGEKLEAHVSVDAAEATVRGKQRISLGKVSVVADAKGSMNEAISITRLELSSTGLGTSFSATGSLDLRPRTAPVGVGEVVVVGRESAYLRGTLTQDLAPLAASIPGLGARGRIRAPLVVAAGNRSLVRIDGTVELTGVSVDWLGGFIEGVEGRVPIAEDLRIDGDSIRLVPSSTNAFSRERFEDQQPLVAETAFVRVKRIVVGEHEFGPLGASVRIDRNTLAIDRLELRALNGSIGGRLFVDVRGADTRLDFRGDVSGLELAADKKPLDAHLAIRLKPWRRALEGRVDVARTSPDQLRLLLDLYDPYQENVSANRARQALALGYPKSVRMRFLEGFASLGIELGGLTSAVRIDETRGVPIAPMLEKSLLPSLPKEPPQL